MEISSRQYEQLQSALHELIGLTCWATVYGRGNEHSLLLEIGQKIRRTRRISKGYLGRLSRVYKGEYRFFIQSCAWRIENSSDFLCTSQSSRRRGGETASATAKIVDSPIVACGLTDMTEDPVMLFANGLKLRAFCDCADSEQEGYNYIIHTPARAIAVGSDRLIEVDER
jgi:hypothetical protein